MLKRLKEANAKQFIDSKLPSENLDVIDKISPVVANFMQSLSSKVLVLIEDHESTANIIMSQLAEDFAPIYIRFNGNDPVRKIVESRLSEIGYQEQEIEDIKSQHPCTLVIDNYSALGRFVNLWVSSKLYEWHKIKIIYVCDRKTLCENKDYKKFFMPITNEKSAPAELEVHNFTGKEIVYHERIPKVKHHGKEETDHFEQRLEEHPLNARNFVGTGVMQFWVDDIMRRKTTNMFDFYWYFLEASKKNQRLSNAGSNAATLLNLTGQPFSLRDLREANIPYADLTSGIFDLTDLRGANLQGAKLNNAWLVNTNTSGANLTEVDLGELPSEVVDGQTWCVTFSPDSKYHAISYDNGVGIFDENDSLVTSIVLDTKSKTNYVRSINFSHDNKKIYIYAENNGLSCWSLPGAKLLNQIPDEKIQDLRCFLLSSDQERLYVPSKNDIVVYNTKSFSEIERFTGHHRIVTSLALSKSEEHLFSGSGDNTIIMWDTKSKKQLRTFFGENASIILSPDEKYLFSVDDKNMISHWEIETTLCLKKFKGHTDTISALAIDPSSTVLYSSSHDQTIRSWNVMNEMCTRVYTGHTGWVRDIALSSDGKKLISGGNDGIVRRWLTGDNDKALSPTESNHAGSVYGLAFNADFSQVFSGGSDSTVRCWDNSTGLCTGIMKGHAGWITSLAFDVTRNLLFSGSGDNSIRSWDVKTTTCKTIYVGHTDTVRSVEVSKNGQWLLSGSHDNTVKRWDIDSGECVCTYYGHNNNIYWVTTSSDNSWLLSGSYDTTIIRWDLMTGEKLNVYEGHTDGISTIIISHDDSWFISGSLDETFKDQKYDAKCKLWTVENEETLNTFEEFYRGITCLALSEDDRWIFVGSSDNTLKCFDLKNENCVITIELPHEAQSIVCSKNDIVLATEDGCISWWKFDIECLSLVLLKRSKPWGLVTTNMQTENAIGLTQARSTVIKQKQLDTSEEKRRKYFARKTSGEKSREEATAEMNAEFKEMLGPLSSLLNLDLDLDLDSIEGNPLNSMTDSLQGFTFKLGDQLCTKGDYIGGIEAYDGTYKSICESGNKEKYEKTYLEKRQKALKEASIYLDRACSNGDLNLMYQYLRLGVTSKLLIINAAKGGHMNLIEFILKHQHCGMYEKDVYNWNAAHWAAKNDHLEVLKFIYENHNGLCQALTGSGMLNGRETLLTVAIRYNANSVAEFLIEQHFMLDKKDQNRWHPLRWAYDRDNIRIFSLLLIYGSNPNASIERGNYLIHLACSECKLEYVRMLIELPQVKKVNISKQNHDAQTPLSIIQAILLENKPETRESAEKILQLLLSYVEQDAHRVEDSDSEDPYVEQEGNESDKCLLC